MNEKQLNTISNQQSKLPSNVSEWIRNKIEDEGVQARNIIKYNVPVDSLICPKRIASKVQFSSLSPRTTRHCNDTQGQNVLHSDVSSSNSNDCRISRWCGTTSPNSLQTYGKLGNNYGYENLTGPSTSNSNASSVTSSTVFPQSFRRFDVSPTKEETLFTFKSRNRMRSSLTEHEYRARYWGQMLDTLRRTIDEIYSACENDESEVECKEVIMILEHSKQDFFSLIEKMNLLRDYEQADEQNKPNSLAWDERTTLPGKPIMCQVLASAAVAAVTAQTNSIQQSIDDHPYLSIPFNLKSENNHFIELGDSDSDLGTRYGSLHLLISKHTDKSNHPNYDIYNNNITNLRHNLNVDKRLSHHNRTNKSMRDKENLIDIDVNSCRNKSKLLLLSSTSSSLNPNLSDLENDVETLSVGNDVDADEILGNEDRDGDMDDDEIDNFEDYSSIDRTCEHNISDIDDENQKSNNNNNSYNNYLIDIGPDETEDVDQDDNTLSFDLKQLDEAIASVTTVERALSDQLDRAQIAEAALRRRLIKEEKAATVATRSNTFDQSYCTEENTGSRSDFSNSAKRDRQKVINVPECYSEGTIVDPDVDLLDVESIMDGETNNVTGDMKIIDLKATGSHWSKEHIRALKTRQLDSYNEKEHSYSKIHRNKNDATEENTHKRTYHYRQCCTCQCHASPDSRYPNMWGDTNPLSADIEVITPKPFLNKLINKTNEQHCRSPKLEHAIDESISSSECFERKKSNNEYVRTKRDYGTMTETTKQNSLYSHLCPFVQQQIANGSSLDLDALNHKECQHCLSKVLVISNTPDNTTSNLSPDQNSNHLPQESLSIETQNTVCQLPFVTAEAVGTQNGLLFIPETGAKSRVPGHGVQMHEKLSARSKRKTSNSIQELEEKQARARILRQQHLLERSERVHELSKKVNEVHMQKRLLLHQRRSCLERRLHAAERKRQAELTRRVLKAHDEETKGKEIAFIQTLEAEQKQHSILTKHEESRARLHELAAERRRRLEEKLGREEAAKIRRRALEASRRARLDALQARWESRAQQLASRAELLEHSRRAAARAKEQHREVKMATLEEQQRTHIEQLRFRIQRKQEESEKRHQESLREISRKAFEMSVLTHTGDDSFTIPAIEPYPIQKWCRACQVMIVSEVSLKSHLHGKRHQNAILLAAQNRPFERSELEAFNLSHLVDAPADLADPNNSMEQERQKLLRKRARKLRQKMNQRAALFTKELEIQKTSFPESPNKSQLLKTIKDARRFLNLPDSGPWVITRIQAMEKSLNTLLRIICTNHKKPCGLSSKFEVSKSDTPNTLDKQICITSGLLTLLVNLIGLIRDQKPSSTQIVPDKTYQNACQLLQAVCYSCPEAHIRMLLSNEVSVLVDCLVARFSYPNSTNRYFGYHSTDVNSSYGDQNENDLTHWSNWNICSFDLLDCLTSLLNGFCGLSFLSRSSDSQEHGTGKIDLQRIHDLLSYIVCSGLVDLLASRISSPRQANWLLHICSPGRNASSSSHGSGSHSSQAVEHCQRFILSSISFLTSLIRLLAIVLSGSNKFINPQINYKQTEELNDNLFNDSGKQSVLSTSDGRISVTESDSHEMHENKDKSTYIKPTMNSHRCPSDTSHDTRLSSSLTTNWNASSERTDNSILTDNSHSNIILDDSTQLLKTIVSTEVFGLVPLLYSLLLDPNNRSNGNNSFNNTPRDPKISNNDDKFNKQSPNSNKSLKKFKNTQEFKQIKTVTENNYSNYSYSRETLAFHNPAVGEITLHGLKLINSLATVNQATLQTILGGELTCLLMRHILLNLLTRCTPESNYSSTFSGIFNSVISKNQNKSTDTCPHTFSTPDEFNTVCQPKHSGQSSKTSHNQRVDDDEMSKLLPSGARQVVIRTQNRRNIKCEQEKTISHTFSPLPNWADDMVISSTLNNCTDNVQQDTHSLKKYERYENVGQLTENVLHETILCIGHLCALNSDNQTSLQIGPSPNLLQRLVSLPFDYFSHRSLADVIYPTLIACCYKNPANTTVLESELNPALLANYIEERLLEQTMAALTDPHSNKDEKELSDLRFRFEHRFPVSEWHSAKTYFER